MISRRVVVQRWPAVPTAPNTAPRMAISMLACSLMMMALLPPSSSSAFPNRALTVVATAFPIRTEPVADNNAVLSSAESICPTLKSPLTIQLTPSGTPFFMNTSEIMFWHAMLHNGVFSDGFQMQTSPHTHASMAFQDQTATGKLNAVITPTIPNGWYCSYIL